MGMGSPQKQLKGPQSQLADAQKQVVYYGTATQKKIDRKIKHASIGTIIMTYLIRISVKVAIAVGKIHKVMLMLMTATAASAATGSVATASSGLGYGLGSGSRSKNSFSHSKSFYVVFFPTVVQIEIKLKVQKLKRFAIGRLCLVGLVWSFKTHSNSGVIKNGTDIKSVMFMYTPFLNKQSQKILVAQVLKKI